MVTSIIDKVALWMLCMLSIILFGITTQFVFVTLLVTIIVGLEITEKMNEKTLEFIIIVYTILCIVLMEGVGFVPLFTYIARRYRMNLALFCFVPVSFYIGFQSLYGVSGWLAPLGLIIPLVTIFSVIAWTLEVRTKQYLEIEGRYRELRDNATERNRRLHDENTQLIERQDYEVHLATLQERNRIAREIHDHVGHMLTRGILQVGALQAANKSADLQAPIDSIQETLNIAMTNIRTSVHDLHDESIDLKTAIDEMLSRFPSYSFFFQYDIKQDVKKEIKYCILAVIKEALNNIVKHSNADEVLIKFFEHPGFYQLIIGDNGTKVSRNYSGGIGLENMKQRVHSICGNMNISITNGFRITITVMK